MIIRSVEFLGSQVDPDAPAPVDLPQIAFAGRSNVGKSSLINSLLQRTRKKIAHVSGQPGKTQTLNFYSVNDRFLLVDLPGFGYAKVPMTLRASWQRLVRGYMAGSRRLHGVVHLVDSRRDPSDDDLAMLDFLAELGLPTIVVATKIDKIRSNARERRLTQLVDALQIDGDQLLVFSARTGEGREELLDAIGSLVDEAA